MKSSLTLILALFTITSLFAQTVCTVRIVSTKNSTTPASYTFKTDPQTAGAKYYWTFGDNTISDSPAPTHTFTKEGSYLVQVKVTPAGTSTTGNGCYGELKDNFGGGTVIPPVVTLTAKGKVKKVVSTDGCGLLITLDNGTVVVPVEMAVPFEFKNDQYVELAYNLLKDKPSGCASGVSAKITKIYDITPATVCTVKIVSTKNSTTPASYTFKTDPQTAGAKYYWTFGDNTISDSPAPTHTFTKEGSYLVQVKVTPAGTSTTGNGCYGELKDNFGGGTVIPPVVTLTAKGKVKKIVSTDGCGLLITLDNGTVIVPVEMAVPFEFKNDQYVELAYNLLKDKPSGCASGVSAKITKIYDITPATVCTVKIVSTKNSTTPASYTFKTDPVNTTAGTKYYWVFGDNTISDSPAPAHTFTKADSYLVQVKVIGADGKGCYGELKAQFDGGTVIPPVVTVSAKGKVKKVVSTDGCGLLITLDNGTVVVPVEMAVPFEFKNDQYVELAYNLLKDKPSGCASGVSAKITKIYDITPATVCTVKIVSTKNSTTPASYTFKTDPVNTAAGTKYYWYFGDNTTSDSPAPVHTYSKADSYLVQVKVLGTDGKVCYGELKTPFEGTTGVVLPSCKGPVNLLLFDPTNNNCNGSATVKLLDEAGKEISNAKYKWSDGRTGSSVGNLCPEKIYTVQAVIENVCQKNTSFTMLSKPLWNTSTLNGQNNFTVIAPVEGVQYEWNFGDGKVMTGSNVNYNFQKDGIYDVTLKAISISGTSQYSQPVVVSQSIAKTEMISKPEIEIYPNPAKEILRVGFKNSAEGNLTFEIKNMAGQIVYKNQINNDGSSQADINIQNLKAGMYVLRISNGQEIIGDRKFIKVN